MFHTSFYFRIIFQNFFYDPVTRNGFFSYRLKTVNRRGAYNKKNKDSSDEDIDSCPSPIPNKKCKKKTPSHASATVSSTDFGDDIQFLKGACPNTQRREIFERMKKTYIVRSQSSQTQNILIEFPRFLDTPGLVNFN